MFKIKSKVLTYKELIFCHSPSWSLQSITIKSSLGLLHLWIFPGGTVFSHKFIQLVSSLHLDVCSNISFWNRTSQTFSLKDFPHRITCVPLPFLFLFLAIIPAFNKHFLLVCFYLPLESMRTEPLSHHVQLYSQHSEQHVHKADVWQNISSVNK